MTAKIIVLAEWKAEHPPLLRLWQAHCRCVSAWAKLWVICSKSLLQK